MNGIELVRKALALIARLPKREVSDGTAKAYRRTFARMRRESPAFDPLKENIARDTFNHRRAALHFGSRRLLKFLAKRTVAAAERQDAIWLERWAHLLSCALGFLAPAIERDPPLLQGGSSFDMPPSRWRNMAAPPARRGKGSKKHSLKKLPRDWTDTLWNAALPDWPYQRELAVHMLVPSRPQELVPGMRPDGWSPGAVVELQSPRLLQITIAPVKHHGGRYGSPTTTVRWDPVAEGGPAAYLAELCDAAGGQITVSMVATNPMRKSLAKLGKRAFPGIKVTITPACVRAQLLADLKATVGGGEQVAAAAGHSTDRTQARYGYVQHGRRRKGFRGVIGAKPAVGGNVTRARHLGYARRQSAERSS